MYEQLARLIRDTLHYHNVAYVGAHGRWVYCRPQIKINDIAFTVAAEEFRK